MKEAGNGSRMSADAKPEVVMIKQYRAQIISEYALTISVIVLAAVTMFPLVKRSTQKLTKLAADQIGNQVNSDQDFNEEKGYLINFQTKTRVNATDDDWYSGNVRGHSYYDRVAINTTTYTNQGFTGFQSPNVTNSWVDFPVPVGITLN